MADAAPRRQKRPPSGQVHGAVLAAAERLLERVSLEELTVRELAREAGVSRASFYFYFESKRAVVAALLESVLDEIYEASKPWLERSDTAPGDALRQAAAGSLELWRRRGAVLRAAAETTRTSPEIGELWRGHIERFIDAAAAQIERDRAAGVAPPDGLDSNALAAALIWMNERTFYVMTSVGEPALSDDPQLAETLAAIWLRAIYRI